MAIIARKVILESVQDASGLAALAGMAPVTEQSGKSHKVYRRMRCDHFLRQTFHEYASWCIKFLVIYNSG